MGKSNAAEKSERISSLTSNLCLHEGANSDRGDDGIHAYEPKGSNRHHDRVAGLDCGRGTQLRDLGTYGHRGEEMRPLTAPEGHNEKRPPREAPSPSQSDLVPCASLPSSTPRIS